MAPHEDGWRWVLKCALGCSPLQKGRACKAFSESVDKGMLGHSVRMRCACVCVCTYVFFLSFTKCLKYSAGRQLFLPVCLRIGFPATPPTLPKARGQGGRAILSGHLYYPVLPCLCRSPLSLLLCSCPDHRLMKGVR